MNGKQEFTDLLEDVRIISENSLCTIYKICDIRPMEQDICPELKYNVEDYEKLGRVYGKYSDYIFYLRDIIDACVKFIQYAVYEDLDDTKFSCQPPLIRDVMNRWLKTILTNIETIDYKPYIKADGRLKDRNDTETITGKEKYPKLFKVTREYLESVEESQKRIKDFLVYY